MEEKVNMMYVSELNGVDIGEALLFPFTSNEYIDADFYGMGNLIGIAHSPYLPFTLTVRLESGRELHFRENVYNPKVWPNVFILDGAKSVVGDWELFR